MKPPFFYTFIDNNCQRMCDFNHHCFQYLCTMDLLVSIYIELDRFIWKNLGSSSGVAIDFVILNAVISPPLQKICPFFCYHYATVWWLTFLDFLTVFCFYNRPNNLSLVIWFVNYLSCGCFLKRSTQFDGIFILLPFVYCISCF